MQAEDWGRYTQEPWMTTGGAWKDTDPSQRSKKKKNNNNNNNNYDKTTQPAQSSTAAAATVHPPTDLVVVVPSDDDDDNDNETSFRTEVDRAELRLQLRRWNFARSWKKTTATCSRPDEEEEEEGGGISPLSRRNTNVEWNLSAAPSDPHHNNNNNKNKENANDDHHQAPTTKKTKKDTSTSTQDDDDTTTTTTAPPLDKDTIAQYLDRCIAVTETQLAAARSRREKNWAAVKEIERLVGKVVGGGGEVR